MKAVLAAGAIAAVLTGCANSHPQAAGSAVKSNPPVSARATPTPSPTPTVLTTVQARAAYLALITPSNRDLKKLNALTASTGAWPLAELRRWARVARSDIHREAIGLRTTLWPASVAPVAHRMADAESVVIPELTLLAGDTSQADAGQDWNAAATATAKPGALGEQMRELLGLPVAK